MTDRIPTISPRDLHRRLHGKQPGVLLDVRSPDEYRSGHVRGALSLPLDELDITDLAQHTGIRGIGTEVPLYVACHSGLRAQQAAEKLYTAGRRNLILLQGGTEAWRKEGLPIRRSGSALSLEQQVQVAIGTLLILKVLFGFTVHELFFVLGALIGAGLITAGLTRWCGLAQLIARMPWNRGRGGNADQAAI